MLLLFVFGFNSNAIAVLQLNCEGSLGLQFSFSQARDKRGSRGGYHRSDIISSV